ncbi:MAG: metal ABC transporter permease [Gemmatimonadales bacterium]
MRTAPSELLLLVAMAAAAGLVGSVAVMRRMALASDAVSHVALPGVAIAVLLRVNPVLGGLVALFLGSFLIWALEHKTRLSTEAVIGVVFSAALAIGSMLASGEELLAALFGGSHDIGVVEVVLGMAAAALVIVYVLRERSRLVIALISPELARTTGINVSRINLVFLLMFALTVALGLRFLGVLLMGSLIIIPAVTATYLARSLRALQLTSVALAIASTLAGSLLAPRLLVEEGALFIVVAASLFLVALAVRSRSGKHGGASSERVSSPKP